jgi:hypothetical protein
MVWMPYRLTQLLKRVPAVPTKQRLRKVWCGSGLFRSQQEVKRRWAIAWMGRPVSTTEAPMRVTLCRIIGNDLFPRHSRGQALANLRTILRDEGNPYGWRKLFVLNRMVDAETQQQAEQLIREAGYECEVIPFEVDAYQALRYRPETFGGIDYFLSPAFLSKDPFQQDRERIWACGEKIRYLMNINGARNCALANGHLASDWTLVLDGSCIVPPAVFDALQNDMHSQPAVPYLIVSMRRLPAGTDLRVADVTPTDREEPQIAFRSDALEQFDEAYPYGVRDKTSLLHRLGVPGPWCAWAPLAWHRDPAARSPDRHLYKFASASVLRLTSGVANGALELPSAQMKRYRSRITAIFATLQAMDARCQCSDAEDLVAIAGLAECASVEVSL